MISAETLRAMVAAGASAEVIVAAVEAEQSKDDARVAARRAKDAERKRRSRVRDVTRTDADTDGQGVTAQDTSPPEVSPKEITQTPILPSPSETKEARAPHRMPRDFRLSRADRDFARELGWSEGEIDDGQAELVDYWSNPKLPASKALKLDWSAVWRNRVRDLGKRRGRSAVTPFRQPGASHGNRPDRQQPSGHDRFLAGMARAVGALDEPGGIPPDDHARSDWGRAEGGWPDGGGTLLRLGSR